MIQEESSDDEVDQQSSKVQTEILKQLKRVNDRLDAVEDRMAVKHHQEDSRRRKDSELSKFVAKKCSKSVKKLKVVTSSESSSDESDVPDIVSLRSSSQLQKKVHERLEKLEKHNAVKGKSGT